MPNSQVKSLTINGTTYDIVDETSGYITGITVLSYGTSTYADALAAYQANRIVYCRASSNSNPATGNQSRMAFLAYVNDPTTPTEFEFQYYRSVSSHSDSQQGDQVYVYKLNSSGTWSVTTREAYTKIAVSTGLTSSYSNGVLTASLANTYGDTKNPYGAKTANYVLAGPTSGSAAVPGFRALVADDIPDLSSIYLTSYTETDPTVPSWAKASSKPSYSLSEISGTTNLRVIESLSGFGLLKKEDEGVWSLDKSSYLTSNSTLNAAKLDGAIPSGVTATTQSSSDNSTKIATTAYVTAAIAALPEPMLFKGSVGTGGTITSLPAASSSNEGYTYKVITDLSTPVVAKIGDTVISNGGSWIVIPSGDEPSGTVTSVSLSNASNGGLTISGSPITSSGTISIGHSNVLAAAQTTQAVYPIKIDKNGHITEYGSAVTIPTIALNGSSTTSPSFYAPTTAGTDGYYLKSNGSGAPTWASITIPTVNNATLTIQKNGTTVNTFTANASSNVTANITVPTKVSDLTNDSGFITGYTETDPIFTASAAYGISSSDITNWNGKTSNTGTVTNVAVGIGLTTANGSAITSTGTIKTKLKSETAITDTSKVYYLGVDSDGYLITKVDWSDVQTKTSDSGTSRTIYLAGGTTSSDEIGELSKHDAVRVSVTANNATSGTAWLLLGNSTASTTPGGKEGCIRLYGSSTSFTNLKVAASTSSKTITFPDKTGTVALTSDIPSSTATPTANEIAEFDSTAHMNSTDMTSAEVSSFVESLNAATLNAVDYIIEQGSSGNWNYTKWNSGKLEQWYYGNPGAYTCSTAKGNWYSGGDLTFTYPIPFIATPTINGSVSLGTSAYVVLWQFNGFNNTSCQGRIVAGSSISSNSNYWIFVYAVGKWK